MAAFHSRGHLPHLHVDGGTQFITWCLHDAITTEMWQEWRQIKGRDPSAELEARRRIESFLDSGHGARYLANPNAAKIVMDELIAGHGESYDLRAAVVMPNHVHVVITLMEGVHLSAVMKTVKGRTARKINLSLSRSGTLWQAEYFDRLVRSSNHLHRCIEYTHWNPVKAKLVEHPTWFGFSTANETWAARLGSPMTS